jgi:carbamoyltransferase
MSRYYVGLACTGHDNALAVVDPGGRAVFAEAIERRLQSKRALGCLAENQESIEQVLDRYCDGATEIVVARTWSTEADACLARAERQYAMLLRVLKTSAGQNDAIIEELADLQYILAFVRRGIRDAGAVVEELCRGKCRVEHRAFDHHLTHAATACFTGPKEEATCAVVDGFGENGNTSFYSYQDGRLDQLRGRGRPSGEVAGLGLFYALICKLCGFDPWRGEEWKVMGLAAYGQRDDEVYELMTQCLSVTGLEFRSPPTRPAAVNRLRSFARKRGAAPLTVANLACTGQLFFADMMASLLANGHAAGRSDNLVLGGGCALNSSFNGQILSRTPFSHLHVFAAPADDGNALGAALLAYHEDHPGERFVPRQSPFLGSIMSDGVLANLRRYQGGLRVFCAGGLVHKRTAELLANGKIVAWVQDRAEFGPRALGNRSLLADPRAPGMKARLNDTVKFREEFRPFAPSILHEYGPRYFVDYQESPYMERTLAFREEVKARVPAVVHFDGTGRLQTVKREWNPRYHDLIQEFHELTGEPLVLNTSFNVMGKPIVHSVEDAVAVLMTSGIDALVIGEIVLEK